MLGPETYVMRSLSVFNTFLANFCRIFTDDGANFFHRNAEYIIETNLRKVLGASVACRILNRILGLIFSVIQQKWTCNLPISTYQHDYLTRFSDSILTLCIRIKAARIEYKTVVLLSSIMEMVHFVLWVTTHVTTVFDIWIAYNRRLPEYVLDTRLTCAKLYSETCK